MKHTSMKRFLIVLCMLTAGICYSCREKQETYSLSSKDGEGFGLETMVTGQESGTEPQSAEPETQEIKIYYVHICGEVLSPGVYEMQEGDRVFQIVERAGGFTQSAAADCLNLAQELQDGMKLTVPSQDEVRERGNQGNEITEYWYIQKDSVSPGGNDKKVNLNTAGKEELMTLNGIGEAKADAIIRYREEFGGFQVIEDVMNISGIKESAFQKIKDKITV